VPEYRIYLNLNTNPPSKLIPTPPQRILSIIVTTNKVFLSTLRDKIERGRHSFTRHTHEFELPISPSTATDQRNPNKAKLKETVLALRAAGWSYREIGREVGLHWTRIGQILKRTAQ
jgi:hypothetical protein